MPGLPKPSSQNSSLLIPTLFVTVSRASLKAMKGKDLISCVVFLLISYNSGSSLKNVYKKHVKRLRRTGEGVQENEDGSQGTEESLSFYIMGDGPCIKTPLHASTLLCPVYSTRIQVEW
jgi:hypothetical protein